MNTSQSGGYWTNAATWSDGIPTSDDDVYIQTGHTITNTGTSQISINSLTITGTLTHEQNGSTDGNLVNLKIGAGGLTIDAAGAINVTGRGYNSGGAGDGRYGGSHGGRGGVGYMSGGVYGGGTYVLEAYGSLTNPVTSGRPSNAQAGGGVVILDVTAGTATINGSILAKGNNGSGAQGGGAGGSINIKARSLSGTGTNSVAGGDGDNGGGGGGGGHIAIVTSGSGFGNLVISAKGGQGWGVFLRPGGSENAWWHGAGGTIYLWETGDTLGKLRIDWEGRAPTRVDTFTIFTNSTYQFDSIITTNGGVFAVGTNATLNLTGCTLLSPGSYIVTNSAGLATNAVITSRLTLGTAGSAVVWPAAWTNNGTISWTGTNVFAATVDLTIASGGILTHEIGSTHNINLNLAGNLTVDSGGAIYADALCNTSFDGRTGRGGASHGGEGGYGGATIRGTTYGSITNPVTYGSSCFGNGGGVAILNVGGAFTNNGFVSARGWQNTTASAMSLGGPSGGSINITVAGDIYSSGRINADGGSGDAEVNNDSPGGGGRIAIKLTGGGKTFGNVDLAKVTARGGRETDSGDTDNWGADGTIYLKSGDESYGKLLVRGNDSSTTARTLISANVTDATVGDVELQNPARFAISNASLTVYGSWSNAVAMSTNASSAFGGTVVFAGTSPNPATVWGGNTWSNLTIATVGKTVKFEAGVTQTVYGVPAFSNVTLQSTSAGSYWYLLKPGSGTQDVGRVTVQDSNATNGWTFRGPVGSQDLGHNVNWIFRQPQGTVFLFR